MVIADLTKTIKGYVKDLCYYKDDIELNNIYTSVLLTFIKKLTLTQADKNKIRSENKGKNGSKRMETKLTELLNDDKWEDGVVIGNTVEKGYIQCVTKLVISKVMGDLNYTTNYHITEDDLAVALIEGGLVIDGKDSRQDSRPNYY